MPRRGRRRRTSRPTGAPFSRTRDQWSAMGKGSSTVALTLSGSATADSMIKVVSGHLQISSSLPIRAQLVLRGYGPEDELISSRPIVSSGSTVSITVRAPTHTAWTANQETNHLAWLRVDASDATIPWAYVVTLVYTKVPNNTLVPSGVTSVTSHQRDIC